MPDDPFTTSVWTRPRRSRGRQPALSQDQIVKAALELLDANGADGLSMRRLGAKLGSGATSIYWYVTNKDELLDLAIDAVMGEVRVPRPDDEWRGAAAAMVRDLRDVALRHTWITSLFGVRPNLGPQAMRLSDATIALLTTAGFAPIEAVYAASLLTSHSLAAATNEAAWRTAVARSGLSGAELTAAVASYQRQHADEYPHMAAWTREFDPLDIGAFQEQTFEWGLARVLDGLAMSLPR